MWNLTLRTLILTAFLFTTTGLVHAQKDEMACSQEPGSRFFWVERAFCDLDVHGPDKAQGLIIWNHGISQTLEEWRSPVPPAFRLLQARGWDVIAIKRHNLAERDTETSLYRTVQRTLEEAKKQRAAGYRKLVVAGQSFGGYAALETADRAEFYAAVAMAPGVRAWGATGRLDPTITDRLLERANVARFGLVFPKDDALFGNLERGPSADKMLARRGLPYLLLDETSDVKGHGGGTGGKFALRYGLCLVEFLSAPAIAAGRHACPAPKDDWTVAKELLLPKGQSPPRSEPRTLPAEVRSLAGTWYGLVEETLVLFALIEGPGTRAMYRWVTTRPGGGHYDATIRDGQASAKLPNRASITVAPAGDEAVVLTWTSADGSRVLKGTLRRAAEE